MLEKEPVSFRRLIYDSLPEMWAFQSISSLILTIPTYLISRFIKSIAESGGGAFTSANIKTFLLSWKAPAMLALFIIEILIFVITELFAQIHMTGNILRGEQVRVRHLIKKGAESMKRFFSGTGILAIIYIFIAAPLCGVGFTISLSSSFYIPNFIMEVVMANPLFIIAYVTVMILLAWIGYRSAFMLHGVLLDNKSPEEARKESWILVKQNRRAFVKGILKDLLVTGIIPFIGVLLFSVIPITLLENWAVDLPKHYVINALSILKAGASDEELSLLMYRIFSSLVALSGKYFTSVINMLCGSYFSLCYTRRYFSFTGRDSELWPARRKRARYYYKVLWMAAVLIIVILASLVFAFSFDDIAFSHDSVKVIAHRAGGKMASENSLEGLALAIEHGCYGSEIDVQRTKDGYYVINHDNTFQRVAGVNRAVYDMTLEEIKQLRIKDTTGSGELLPVPTFEEMLPIIKGKEKLFVELKGSTADRQMVDDVVAMIRQAGCTDDCVLISLNYDTISYAETNYPEFETGLLFFLGIGDVSRLNCDMLIMEEETATQDILMDIQASGKKAIVWTVNTETGMNKFLKSWIFAVITDDVLLAEKVQGELDQRTDFEIMLDLVSVD